MLRPVLDAGSARFAVDVKLSNLWNCFSAIGFYCCNILEDKDMLCVKNYISGAKPCIRYLVTTKDIHDIRESDNQQLSQTVLARQGSVHLLIDTESLDKKTFYGKKRTFVRAAQDN